MCQYTPVVTRGEQYQRTVRISWRASCPKTLPSHQTERIFIKMTVHFQIRSIGTDFQVFWKSRHNGVRKLVGALLANREL